MQRMMQSLEQTDRQRHKKITRSVKLTQLNE